MSSNVVLIDDSAAQVHGFCLTGGSELATCCDLV